MKPMNILSKLNESDEQENIETRTPTCFACGRPASSRDEMGKFVCDECSSYMASVVELAEFTEEDLEYIYSGKIPYYDFKRLSPDNWKEYFPTLEPENIPFKELTDEAYNIYLM